MNKVTSLLQTAARLVTTQMVEWSLLHDTKTWPLLGWPVVQPRGGSMRGFNLQLEHKEKNDENNSGSCHDKDAHHLVVLLLVRVSLLQLLQALLNPGLHGV